MAWNLHVCFLYLYLLSVNATKDDRKDGAWTAQPSVNDALVTPVQRRPFTEAEIAHYMALAWDEEVSLPLQEEELNHWLDPWEEGDQEQSSSMAAPPDQAVPLPSLHWFSPGQPVEKANQEQDGAECSMDPDASSSTSHPPQDVQPCGWGDLHSLASSTSACSQQRTEEPTTPSCSTWTSASCTTPWTSTPSSSSPPWTSSSMTPSSSTSSQQRTGQPTQPSCSTWTPASSTTPWSLTPSSSGSPWTSSTMAYPSSTSSPLPSSLGSQEDKTWWDALRDRRPLRGQTQAEPGDWWEAIRDTRGIAERRRQKTSAPTCARNPESFTTAKPPARPVTADQSTPQQDWEGWLANTTSHDEPGVTNRFGLWRVGRDRWHRPNGSIFVRQRERLRAEEEQRSNKRSPPSDAAPPGFHCLVIIQHVVFFYLAKL